jgi:HAD superfamily hydrolase (TIGR01484 family)
MLRLVATDLDGTLLRADGSVSARTRRVLRQVSESGLTVVLVSARPIHTLRQFAHAAGVAGLAICSNGATVYDLDRDVAVRHTPLGSETARHLIQALREALPGVCFAFVREAHFACEPAYRLIARPVDHPDDYLAAALLGDAIALCDEAPTKLIARHPSLSADDLLARVHALGLVGFEVTHSGAPFVEVAAPGVTKARALAAICADLGIGPDEVVAFGDAPNDLPMLRWAGLGIAVANAHPAVLAEADDIAPSNEDDGVAVVVERLLSGR